MKERRQETDFPALVAALTERIEDLAQQLVGGAPDQARRVWHAKRQRDGGLGDSLIIEIRGEARGKWFHHARGIGGDALELIAHAKGYRRGDAIRWAEGWLGRDFSGEASSHPKAAAKAAHVQDSDKAATLAPKWLAFWNRCVEITDGSPPDRYLTGRVCARPSNDVRWNPETWHPHEQRAMPAIVSLITDIATCEPISLHFTFIAPDGSGKAEIERPRLYLPGHRKSGGIVRLHADDEVTLGIIVGEGLETCLTYALAHAPVWACLDAGNLAAFPVLRGIEGITILVDRDPAGEHAFATLRGRYRDAGFTHALDIIRIAAPEEGQDVNDMVAAA